METPTIENLKARAYDLLAAKQNIESQLQQVNQMISQEMKKDQEDKVVQEAEKTQEAKKTKTPKTNP